MEEFEFEPLSGPEAGEPEFLTEEQFQEAEAYVREVGFWPAPEFAEGPEFPDDLDVGEVFEAVPPGDVFDEVEHTPALDIDRVLYFEKLICFAQAGKADAINDAYARALAAAETGKASKDRWSGEYAAERGFILELACALRIPQGTAQGMIRDSQCLAQALPLTRKALRNGEGLDKLDHRVRGTHGA